MVVGIMIAIVIVIIIVLCVRQAVKGLREAKERAMSKLGALIKRDESLELLNATPDTELEPVQPASSDKKKLVRVLLWSDQLLAHAQSNVNSQSPLKKREDNWNENVSRKCFWDRY